MQEVTIVHEFDCDEDTHWTKCFFSEDFNKKLYLETLGFPMWRILSQVETDATIERKLDIRPLLKNIPGPVMKVMGDRFGYIEDGTFDKKARRYKFRTIPSVMGDKADIRGEMYLEKIGDNKVRRTVKVRVEVKVFAIGGLIEQSTVEQLRDGYEKASAFTRKYIAALTS